MHLKYVLSSYFLFSLLNVKNVIKGNSIVDFADGDPRHDAMIYGHQQITFSDSLFSALSEVAILSHEGLIHRL